MATVHAHDLLLMTRETAVAATIAEVLGLGNRFETDSLCRDLEELAQRLEQHPVPAVLVDLDPSPRTTLGGLEPLIRRHSNTRFVVLSCELRSELVLEAMQIGARHYLVKQAIEADLADVLGRLLAQVTANAGSQGTAVTVLSAGGGCGATTVAVNLAHELGILEDEPTLLIDMDSCYAGVGSYLGVESRYGLADVLPAGTRIDANFLRTTAVEHSPQMRVLVNAATAHAGGTLPDYQHLGRVIDTVKATFPRTVIDAPRVPLDVAITLADASDITLIVLQMTVKDLKFAKALCDALSRGGISQQTILPVVNRYGRRGPMLRLDEAQRVLQGMKLTTLRNDFRAAASSVNFGKPLAEIKPRSAARRDIAQLAKEIVEVTAAVPVKARG